MKKPRDLVLVGGGGHARACLDVIQAQGLFRVAGILDATLAPGEHVLGAPVLGNDDALPELAGQGMSFLITVGHVKTPDVRMRLHARLLELKADLATVIAPSALVSTHAEIGPGTIVMHMAVVGPGARIGANCIVNSRALVEHDAQVGDHCHVATGVIVNGGCRVGSGALVGSGAVLKQGVSVGQRAVVGMGLCLRHDLDAGEIFTGPKERLA